MSKIGQAFGGGSAKPSHFEILSGLRDRKLAKDKAAQLGSTSRIDNTPQGKFAKARLKKTSRLKSGGTTLGVPGVDEESAINRPAARSATLLGN